MTLLDAYLALPLCYFTAVALRSCDDYVGGPETALDVVCVAVMMTLLVLALSIAWPAVALGHLLLPDSERG